MDHWAMPPNEDFKGRFVAILCETCEEVGVGQAVVKQAVEAMQQVG
jgi:hypothetical protein